MSCFHLNTENSVRVCKDNFTVSKKNQNNLGYKRKVCSLWKEYGVCELKEQCVFIHPRLINLKKALEEDFALLLEDKLFSLLPSPRLGVFREILEKKETDHPSNEEDVSNGKAIDAKAFKIMNHENIRELILRDLNKKK